MISQKGEGLQRNMTMRSVTTDVNSPMISQTGTTGLSEMCSKGMGFQFLIIKEPEAVGEKENTNLNGVKGSRIIKLLKSRKKY